AERAAGSRRFNRMPDQQSGCPDPAERSSGPGRPNSLVGWIVRVGLRRGRVRPPCTKSLCRRFYVALAGGPAVGFRREPSQLFVLKAISRVIPPQKGIPPGQQNDR